MASTNLLPKAYEHKDEEQSYRAWESSGFFNPDNLLGARKESFSLSMPPPNVTGSLHIGHAMFLTIEDLMTRFARMQGKRALWVPGVDHAAIATQNVVEKEIYKKEGKTRHEIGRKELVKRINEFVQGTRHRIETQIRRMGSSCDWSRERYTLDPDLSLAVRTVFKKMYDDGLIYRGNRIVNWCPRCKSTLADDEVEYKEQKTKFYYFKYGPVVIGTARPETKFQDKTIIVHPKDKRYKDLVGKELEVEWISGKVKARVIADPVADMEFGTGAMTITPAHSFEDFLLAQKYKLPVVKIIDEEGKLTDAAGAFAGRNAREAREEIVEIFKKKGLVEKIDENYVHNISLCYRCGTPIEPLPSLQWFIAVDKPFKIKNLNLARRFYATGSLPKKGGTKGGCDVTATLKELALWAVRSGGGIKIIPDRFNKTYFHWMENLHDWCISRQIWFGHQIPVWYCGSNAVKRMGFAEDVVPQVFDNKTKTYRLRDYEFNVGDVVVFEDSATRKVFGYGKITNIENTTVGEIDLNDAAHGKTYKKCEELRAAFTRHYPHKNVDDNTPAWIYTYTFDPSVKMGVCGTVIVSAEVPSRCPTCGSVTLQQDPDTLDTWFSSSLWTFSTLGWPASVATSAGKPLERNDFLTYHPTSVMETGYDILFFWVARMIIMTLYAVGDIPFRTVYLHGLVRDRDGKKMSKSAGNGIDPLDMVAKFGADPVRLSLVVGTTPGNDIRLYEEKIAGYRNFVNKLWNIGRFILTTADTRKQGNKDTRIQTPQPATLADQWILSELDSIIESTTKAMEEYRYSAAIENLYDFTWGKFADWYIEIAKFQKKQSLEKSTDSILLHTLEQIIKLWHPFTPFITEELWKNFSAQVLPLERGRQRGGVNQNLLLIQSWPQPSKQQFNSLAISQFTQLQELITVLRAFRAEEKLNPKEKIKGAIAIRLKELREVIADHSALIEHLTKVTLTLTEKIEKPTLSLSHIHLLLDVPKKEKTSPKDREAQEKYIVDLKRRLSDPVFLSKAPPSVVEKERQRLKEMEERIQK
ncbi:MAG: class I tRNA ligase family protein [Patescibacteria group bacterium]